MRRIQAITMPVEYPRSYIDLVDQYLYPRRGLREVQGPPRFRRSYRVVREDGRHDAISVALTDDLDLACEILSDEQRAPRIDHAALAFSPRPQ